ncbi:hypothetical protein COLO4_06335 [Corchorus olitorius]|uniref:Uncharacterized protein n=1 Tax=Corchorus olitorius TaxID=93759 RepID=A0A1R3KNB8_9ROSI|nr:hypothetical protein COLO4_06335 [Corchorus olitorius]
MNPASSSSRVKYTEERRVISKTVNSRWFPMESQPESQANAKAPKVVRISFTDGDATDSSSDECEQVKHHQRVKRHINEIRIEDCSPVNLIKPANKQNKSNNPATTLRSKKQQQPQCLSTGPDALTNFVKPPVRPSPPEIEVEMVSGYDSGQESHTLCSPTSVLRFQSNEEAELQIESKDDSFELTESEWRPEQGLPIPKETSNLSDEYLLTDPGALCDYFDSDNPAPIFFDEMRLPEESINLAQDFSDISFKLDVDFGSCTWDVDNYY